MVKYKELSPKEREMLDTIHDYIEQRALKEIGEFFTSMQGDDKKKAKLKKLLSVHDTDHGSVLEHAYKVAKGDFDAKMAYQDMVVKKHSVH